MTVEVFVSSSVDSGSVVKDFSRLRISERFFDKGIFKVNSEVSYALTGHNDKATRSDCGWVRVEVCLNEEGHRRRDLDGVVHVDEGVGRRVPRHCHNASCRECHPEWVGREARRGELKLIKASKELGLPVEHFSVTRPYRVWGLSEKEARKEDLKALERRGIIGGNHVCHPARFRNKRPYFSPHSHCLGFLKGGYKCRDCEFCKLNKYMRRWVCTFEKVCGGFLQVTRRCKEKDGYIVEVAKERGTLEQGLRKSIRKTLAYELSHCGFQLGGKRARPIVWWGVCSNRKMPMGKDVSEKGVCPVCGHDFKNGRYVGKDEKVLKMLYGASKHDREWRKPFVFKIHDASGSAEWIELESSWRTGGGYMPPYESDGKGGKGS